MAVFDFILKYYIEKTNSINKLLKRLDYKQNIDISIIPILYTKLYTIEQINKSLLIIIINYRVFKKLLIIIVL